MTLDEIPWAFAMNILIYFLLDQIEVVREISKLRRKCTHTFVGATADDTGRNAESN